MGYRTRWERISSGSAIAITQAHFWIRVIESLVQRGVIVICAGGGGIPTVYCQDGSLIGVEAVIDKDRTGALLAQELKADAFLMLTDVKASAIAHFPDFKDIEAGPVRAK